MSPTRPAPPPRPGLLVRTVGGLLALPLLAVLGLLLALLLEFAGLTLLWPEEGAAHGQRRLAAERATLGAFGDTLLGAQPLRLAEQAGATLTLPLEALRRWLASPPAPDEWPGLAPLRAGLRPVLTYADAAGTAIQLYALRLTVAVLALPAFGLFGWVGVVDGLMRRDLRRFGGGPESSFVYHHLKPWLPALLWLPPAGYVLLPVSLHPNAVFLPAATLFALLVAETTARFKKFL